MQTGTDATGQANNPGSFKPVHDQLPNGIDQFLVFYQVHFPTALTVADVSGAFPTRRLVTA
jgi:hypothetical protein